MSAYSQQQSFTNEFQQFIKWLGILVICFKSWPQDGGKERNINEKGNYGKKRDREREAWGKGTNE